MIKFHDIAWTVAAGAVAVLVSTSFAVAEQGGIYWTPAGQQPVVLCAPQLRLAFRRFFENTFSDLAVLSYSEVPARVQVQNAAVIPYLE